jgi:hypothetical protein
MLLMPIALEMQNNRFRNRRRWRPRPIKLKMDLEMDAVGAHSLTNAGTQISKTTPLAPRTLRTWG